MSKYKLELETENVIRVLQRIASVFSRFNINVERMHAEPNPKNQHSNITFVIRTPDLKIENVIKQLQKIIELCAIKYQQSGDKYD
jgi:acetolactate synthase small subunit